MHTVVSRSWTLLFTVLVVAGVTGQTVDDGIAAAQAGDMERAIEIWIPLAEGGDGHAQHNLGLMFYHGGAGAVDYGEAAKWFSMSAAQGFPASEHNLAVMYRLGQGVTADPDRFRSLMSSAASKGFPASLFIIGTMYYNGEGIERDLDLARAFIEDAANQGDPQAIQALQEWDWF